MGTLYLWEGWVENFSTISGITYGGYPPVWDMTVSKVDSNGRPQIAGQKTLDEWGTSLPAVRWGPRPSGPRPRPFAERPRPPPLGRRPDQATISALLPPMLPEAAVSACFHCQGVAE